MSVDRAPTLNPIRKLLHWLIAIMVIAMIPAGLIFTDFDNKPVIESLFGEGAFDRFYNLHKAIGFTILGLMALRVLAMLFWPAPDHQPRLAGPVRVVSKFTHGAFYALLIVTPILGWMGVSAFPAPLPWFGIVEMPPIAPQDKELSRFMLDLHGFAAFAIAGLVLIHVAAGIWHRSVRRDTVFARIGFGGAPAQPPAAEETPAE